MTDSSIRVWSETRQRLNIYASMEDTTQDKAIQNLLDEVGAPELGEMDQ